MRLDSTHHSRSAVDTDQDRTLLVLMMEVKEEREFSAIFLCSRTKISDLRPCAMHFPEPERERER